MRFSSLKDTTRQVTTEARSVVKRARLQQLPASAPRLRWHRGLRVVFGLLLGLIATFRGYSFEPHSAGVSRATTSTVVTASICILLADYLLTALWSV